MVGEHLPQLLCGVLHDIGSPHHRKDGNIIIVIPEGDDLLRSYPHRPADDLQSRALIGQRKVDPLLSGHRHLEGRLPALLKVPDGRIGSPAAEGRNLDDLLRDVLGIVHHLGDVPHILPHMPQELLIAVACIAGVLSAGVYHTPRLRHDVPAQPDGFGAVQRHLAPYRAGAAGPEYHRPVFADKGKLIRHRPEQPPQAVVLASAGRAKKNSLFPQPPDLPQRFRIDRRFRPVQQRAVYITGHQSDHIIVPSFGGLPAHYSTHCCFRLLPPFIFA